MFSLWELQKRWWWEVVDFDFYNVGHRFTFANIGLIFAVLLLHAFGEFIICSGWTIRTLTSLFTDCGAVSCTLVLLISSRAGMVSLLICGHSLRSPHVMGFDPVFEVVILCGGWLHHVLGLNSVLWPIYLYIVVQWSALDVNATLPVSSTFLYLVVPPPLLLLTLDPVCPSGPKCVPAILLYYCYQPDPIRKYLVKSGLWTGD